ncbi:MAG: hypothetical protein Q7O66_18610 [Dehalococcoidia bacterium]|nr:hypothetical protein [Dehalococcoidia bacterium]
MAKERGREYFVRIGRLGGKAVKEKQGEGFYSRIGKLGGDKVKELKGPDYFSRIGRIGGKGKKQSTEVTSPEDADEELGKLIAE